MGNETMPDVKLSKRMHFGLLAIRRIAGVAPAVWLAAILAAAVFACGDDDDVLGDDPADDGTDDDTDDVGGDGFHEGIPPYSGWVMHNINGTLLRINNETSEVIPLPEGIIQFYYLSSYQGETWAVGFDEIAASSLWRWDGSVWEPVTTPGTGSCNSVGILESTTVFTTCCGVKEKSTAKDSDDDDDSPEGACYLWRSVGVTWDDEPLAEAPVASRVECHSGSCAWVADENYTLDESGLQLVGDAVGVMMGGAPDPDGYANYVAASESLGLMQLENDGSRTAYLF
ncbi:MAG: hypothetical protein M5R36_23590 [Deltaproteobacteria bacterium]|nr:hypothetical protein [Deltaproteobacteria bacterium]